LNHAHRGHFTLGAAPYSPVLQGVVRKREKKKSQCEKDESGAPKIKCRRQKKKTIIRRIVASSRASDGKTREVEGDEDGIWFPLP
jgi:hypothetical protein